MNECIETESLGMNECIETESVGGGRMGCDVIEWNFIRHFFFREKFDFGKVLRFWLLYACKLWGFLFFFCFDVIPVFSSNYSKDDDYISLLSI